MSVMAAVLSASAGSPVHGGVVAEPVLPYESPVSSATSRFQFNSTLGNIWAERISSSVVARAEIDEANLTLRFGEFDLLIPGQSATWSESFTVGLGQTETYQIALAIDPIAVSLHGDNESRLVPLTGGNFQVGERSPFSLTAFPMRTLNFRGSYEITGPSSTVSESFAMRLPVWLTGRGASGGEDVILNASLFPDEISLHNTHGLEALYIRDSSDPSGRRIFSHMVDGRSITADVNDFYFRIREPLSLGLVPEPGIVTLACCGLVGFLGRRARR